MPASTLPLRCCIAGNLPLRAGTYIAADCNAAGAEQVGDSLDTLTGLKLW